MRETTDNVQRPRRKRQRYGGRQRIAAEPLIARAVRIRSEDDDAIQALFREFKHNGRLAQAVLDGGQAGRKLTKGDVMRLIIEQGIEAVRGQITSAVDQLQRQEGGRLIKQADLASDASRAASGHKLVVQQGRVLFKRVAGADAPTEEAKTEG